MREKIKNQLLITCTDVDLMEIGNVEFYIKQGNTFLQYTPNVISASEMLVTIPLSDAMQLNPGSVRLQFAFTDRNGSPRATEVVRLTVSELLKEAGYGNTI